MISADDLNQLRTLQEAAMPQRAILKRRTEISDGAGGYKTSPTTIATYPCSVEMIGNSAEEQAIAARMAGRTPYKVKLPFRATVERDDQLVVGGRTFEVVEPVMRAYETARELICIEVS